jgi:prepilin peptidase CpaA
MTTSASLTPIAIVLAASVVAAVTDVRAFRIPNWLTLPLLVCGLLYQLVAAGLPGLGAGLAGAVFGLAVLVPFYALGGMGAGDVKLLAAVGAWLGLALTFRVFVASALAAGLYAIVLLVVTGRWREVWERFELLAIRLATFDLSPRMGTLPLPVQLKRADRRARLIPFGLLVAIGLVVTLARA